MVRRSIVRCVVLTMLCWVGLSAAALAQGVGAIGGTVTDESGAVMPGVTLTLISPGVIGSGQTTITDGKGAYLFSRLVPGRYSVKAELQGFRAAAQENIDVNADKTSRADLKLTVGAVEETVTVSGLAPLLDTTSALKQTELTRSALDTLPTAVDLWSIAQLVPSIQQTTLDVGGRNGFDQGRVFVHGSLQTEMGYYFDGLDITCAQESAACAFPDSYSAQEINYQAGEAPAENARGGVVMNLVTKTGTNKFSGSGAFIGANNGMEGNNVSDPTLKAQLLASVPAKAKAANPNLVPGASLDHMFDSSLTLGGPIAKDRLWFFGSTRYTQLYRYQVGSYNADGTQLLDDNSLTNFMGKVSWSPTHNAQFHNSYMFNRKNRPHQNGATRTQFSDTRATNVNDSRNQVGIHRWTQVLSSKTVLDVDASWILHHNDKAPQADVQPGDISHFDSSTNTITVASPTYSFPTHGSRWQAQASVTYVAGNHDLKGGYQFNRSRRGTFFQGILTDESGMQAIYSNGVPTSVKTYNTPNGSTYFNLDHTAYVQDKWRVTRKLTANIGVRYDHDFERINDGTSQLCQQATVFIAGQCFPAVSGVPNFNFVSPRLSAIYDLFGDGRTALKFVANRYIVSQIGQSDLVNPIKLANDTRPWTVCKAGQVSGCDLNGDLIPQLNELGTSTGFSLGTNNRIDPNLKVPYTNEIAAEIEQQLGSEMVLSVGYHYRARRDLIGLTNMAVPTSGYIPLTVTEKTSGQTVTVYNQDPTTKAHIDNFYSNSSLFDDSYHGVDLSVQKRMSHNWMLLASMTVEKTDGDINTAVADGGNTGDLNNPNFAFRRGPFANDIPFFAKINGAYELPYGFRVAANFQYYTGAPTLTTVLVDSKTVPLTQTSQVIVTEPFGTKRLPNIKTLDFNVAKSVHLGGLKVEPRLDVFNVFNQNAITSETTQLGPSYGSALSLLGSRLIKAGVNINW
jgi:carboxypeptidase family protein